MGFNSELKGLIALQPKLKEGWEDWLSECFCRPRPVYIGLGHLYYFLKKLLKSADIKLITM